MIRRPIELVQTGLVAEADLPSITSVTDRYSMALTPAVIAAIDPADPADPVAAQFVPTVAELHTTASEIEDPIGDDAHSPVTGLVHRYPDRVLVKATLICPVYCRFCFRREMVGDQSGRPLTESQLTDIVEYIGSHPEIWEVILSGGDPLVLSSRRLGRLLGALASVEHVQVVRIHSRVPVVAPHRIDAELVATLRSLGKPVYLVVHANHANEFTPPAREALARLVDGGVPLLSQSVLLAGINDNLPALSTLMRTFVANRVTPYYLHHGDLAPGTAHFRVPIGQGQDLLRQLRGRYSGLCQPTYVLDLPGGHGKVPIAPNYLRSNEDDDWEVESYQGEWFTYPPKT